MKFFALLLLLSVSSFAQDKILVLGDSLTEGYRVASEHSFPSQLERKLIKLKYNKCHEEVLISASEKENPKSTSITN